jgi:hypothetical protein
VGSPNVKGSTVSQDVSCPTGPNACTLTDTLTATETVQGGTVIAARATKKPKTVKKTVVLGKVTVTIAAGQSKIVTVSLNAAGKKLLKKLGKLKVSLTSSEGSKTLSSRPVTFKAANPKRRK